MSSVDGESTIISSVDLKTKKHDAEVVARNSDEPSMPRGDSSDNSTDAAETEAPKIDSIRSKEGEKREEDEEEEGECGFCLFMKGGGCKESFIAWENCIEEAEKNKEDIVTKCMEVTASLKKCMDAHADYYEPILRAEKAAEEEAKKELEREKAEEEAKKDTE